MLKAWNTGHPGGIATVHANSAHAALHRLEQLIQEAVVTVPRRLVAQTIDLVVFIRGRGEGRRIETIAEVEGLDASGDYRVTELSPAHLQTPGSKEKSEERRVGQRRGSTCNTRWSP